MEAAASVEVVGHGSHALVVAVAIDLDPRNLGMDRAKRWNPSLHGSVEGLGILLTAGCW